MHASDLSRAGWRKSSYSNGTGGSCVEITALTGHFREAGQTVAVRDSKDPDGPVLTFTESAWCDFTAKIKTGELDLF
jgi:hypothetical protein